ncbi:manganese/zinc/iron transport system substrate-binding protein [Lishizhenia tianjinensis]|uniref:Manganese/zinc/iron transport system substrate-binding protein n=1 Tax=Lishizhenia tianjinensis TaxID=477690 RepID=A0A1I6YPG9_9FLAO|nr:zinc ABC transporter substrate-binding protein [Lishizhenia tianjinensis]SFT52334.1 manganese/zinc/iron transport system substrate-binding protein [Lishizhenia tianjinensis]
MKKIVVLILILGLAVGCKLEDQAKNDGKLKVVCTTSMIGDCFLAVLDSMAEVTVLMGPGVDPHLYDARPSDLKALDEADVIIYNGFHLEGKFVDKFEKLARTKKVIALGDFVKEKAHAATEFANAIDPHFWFDPQMWAEALQATVDSLNKLYPEYQATWSTNFANYKKEVEAAETFVEEAMFEIPVEERVLVTSHDAFNYFGRRFGVEVKALQGISTLSEAGIKEVSNLVDFIIAHQVKCIFVESSVSQKALKSVKENCAAQGYTVAFGEELFSDAMGAAGSPEGTYPGMLKANAQRINKGILSHD